jgi:hypothetical protein
MHRRAGIFLEVRNVKSQFLKGIVAASLVAMIPAQVFATEPFAKVGTYSMQFLKIGVSARASGMGNAFTAIANDASATYWNPGGLVDVTRTDISLSYTWWPADIALNYAAGAFTLPFIPGTWGVSARALTMDPQVVRTIYLPEGTGETFDSGDMSFGLSYAKFFTDKFSSGATVHFLHSGLADKSVNAFAVDFGLIYRIGLWGMRLGMLIQSLGSKVNYDDRESKMPTVFKVAMAATPYSQGVNSVQGVFEFTHPSDNQERINLGAEYGFNQFFFLRGGYDLNADTEGLAAGMGLRVDTSQTSDLTFDYAWSDMSEMGEVHRISLGFTY